MSIGTLPRARTSSARSLRGWWLALVVGAALFVALLFSAPYWAGYFGPRAAVYAAVWSPGTTHIAVTYDAAETQVWATHAGAQTWAEPSFPGLFRIDRATRAAAARAAITLPTWPRRAAYQVGYRDAQGDQLVWAAVERTRWWLPWRAHLTGGGG